MNLNLWTLDLNILQYEFRLELQNQSPKNEDQPWDKIPLS